MRLLSLALILLWPADLAAQCAAQNYSSAVEPDWDCEAPMEGALVPKLNFVHPTVALDLDTPAPFAGMLLEQGRVMSLGLRIKALRRLLWLETQDRQKLIEIEKKQVLDSAKADIDLVTYQKGVWQNIATQTEDELKEAKKWWRSWAFGYTIGSVVTVIGLGATALLLR